ncbi:disulfide bond formation protein B [Oricola nitratireducens]|uniref:disulfide bond formation protein B n=1 Tax=Oricola nitratireducens TaxID=2775868 RepID=UPI001867D242|nr:disulfide bond formation protein B [Oricola nitratireducens]
MTLTSGTGRLQLIGAAFLAVAMAAVVGTALGFEHIGGFIPCKLCLEQRIPYYAGVPVALVALAGAALGWRPVIVRGLLLIVGLLMTYGLYLGIYHSGVEWHWWAGPADCSTSATSGILTDAGGLLGALDTMKPPSCDEAAGRFLRLSFAGWNVLASLGLAAIAYRAAFGPSKR